jgi:hypothetical protein
VEGSLKTCQNCGDKKPQPFFEDIRDPPLDEGKCICEDCHFSNLVEVEEELSDRLDEVRKERLKLEVKQLKQLNRRKK